MHGSRSGPLSGSSQVSGAFSPEYGALSPEYGAFRAETRALSGVAAGLTQAELDRPSPCPPWRIADLLCHVIIATGRIGPAIDAAAEASGALVTAAGYYRPDQRFSAGVNADRIDIAAALAVRLGTAESMCAELNNASSGSLTLLESCPAGQRVRTRHGDLMLLSEFAATRVVELAVHGLDLAAGLGRSPWLTAEAATVVEKVLLPGGATAARALRERLGCDSSGLIARMTGRTLLSDADSATLASYGVAELSLG